MKTIGLIGARVYSWGSGVGPVYFALVIGSSLERRRALNFIPLGGARMRQKHFLQSLKRVEGVSHKLLVLALQILKMGGHFRVLLGRRNIFWKHVNASVPFSPGRRRTLQCGVSRFVAAQYFVTRGERSNCHESQGQACLEKWQKLRKTHTFWSFVKT